MLAPQARLGAYEVVGPLGAGGMGEVYRARDTRLGREVALKLIHDSVAQDAERLSRFEREARLLAALNHPAIATLYGFEQPGGRPFLVMELVEGPTLAERLRRGALPLREALEVARQVAEALEAAHGKGIVHRDLKPSNVKLTREGRVKVLDFGLAKALRPEEMPPVESVLSTDTVVPTETGVVLGTAPYMSPEQARGALVDAQTDVWAFGCLLYEMLSGKRAFAGPTASDVIAAILEREPQWPALPGSTPAPVRSLLRRCLQKDQAARVHDIADARIEIEEALTAPALAAAAGVRPSRLALAAMALAAGVLGGAAGTWVVTRPRPPAVNAQRRLTVELPRSAPLPTATEESRLIAVSPDGGSVAYVGLGETRQIYLRPLDRLEATPIAGTEGGSNPFFSPDGRWLGFAAGGKLKKVSLAGGSPRVLCDVPGLLRGASWTEDGTIVFTSNQLEGLFRIPAEGGVPQPLTTPDPETRGRDRWPQVLPGGQVVLFTIYSPSGRQDEARVATLSLVSGKRKVLVEGGSYGQYVPTGHLLYANAGSVFAAAFDPARLEITGPASPVLEDVRMSSMGNGVAQLDFSSGGLLAYVSPHWRSPARQLVWMDRQGAVRPLTTISRSYQRPRLSPDLQRLVVEVVGTSTIDLWQCDMARDAWTRLTFEKDHQDPIWSPDGQRIAFASNRDGNWNLYSIPSQGGAVERLTTSANWQFPSGWSPEGRTLIFHENDGVAGHDIWELPLDGERRPRPLVATAFSEHSAVLSPDGRWLAYVSDESGRPEVYVRAYRGPDRKWLVSNEGGFGPRWTRSGREIVYRSRARIMAVAVSTTPTFGAGPPRVLLDRPLTRGDYDMTPEGERLVFVDDTGNEPERLQLVVVPDWFDELKAKVGRR